MFIKGIQSGFEEAKEGAELASEIYEIAKRDVLSPAYVEELKKLEKVLPDAVETLYFYGLLALNQGNKDIAEKILMQAWEKRKLNNLVIHSLGNLFQWHDNELKTLPISLLDNEKYPWLRFLYFLLLGGNSDAILKAPMGFLWKYYAFLKPYFAPFVASRSVQNKGKIIVGKLALGFPLPYGLKDDVLPYYVGIYNEIDLLGKNYYILNKLYYREGEFSTLSGDVDFNIMRMQETLSATFQTDGTPFIIYLLSSDVHNDIMISDMGGGKNYVCQFPAFETKPIRFEGKVRITSEHPFCVSRPIPLRHSPKRRKLVLNILLDALSWAMQKKLSYVDVPHICDFFKDGVIFDDNFSTAEYTYPSLGSIETGMHMHHNQIFHPDSFMELSKKYQTLSEAMSDLGYYSVQLMGDTEAFMNGVGRGYERFVVTAGLHTVTSRGVDRLLRYLEAFNETDNFIFLHVADTHPYGNNVEPMESSRTHYPLDEVTKTQGRTSVFFTSSPMAIEANRENICRADRFLGVLFDYIREHYDKDEVMINLYSDHGLSIYDDDWLLADNHVGSALMCYGGGVPALGHVDELTSNLDLYKIMGYVLGFPTDMSYLDGALPKAFGGRGHEYVITNSIYPGQAYKLAIRTKIHEFRLETKALTQLDGSVDMRDFNYQVFQRKTHETIADRALADYFLEIAKRHTKPFWKLLS